MRFSHYTVYERKLRENRGPFCPSVGSGNIVDTLSRHGSKLQMSNLEAVELFTTATIEEEHNQFINSTFSPKNYKVTLNKATLYTVSSIVIQHRHVLFF